jgi:hypothetical protein
MVKTPQFGRAFRACSAGFHVQPLVRPFLVQALAELVELVLLVKEFLAAGCFPAARQVEEPEVEVLTSQDMSAFAWCNDRDSRRLFLRSIHWAAESLSESS